MLDFVQQLVSGIALGCVYGLIALGFVLVYKATEVVNFAQGDLMMLGAFSPSTSSVFSVSITGLAVAAMALFGMLAERLVVRPILGYPQFSIIMATIGLGFFPALGRGHDLGHRRSQDRNAVQRGRAAARQSGAGYDKLSVIAATVILCGILYLFFNKTTLGTAMRASSREHARSLLHGHSGQAGGVHCPRISAAVATWQVCCSRPLPSFTRMSALSSD